MKHKVGEEGVWPASDNCSKSLLVVIQGVGSDQIPDRKKKNIYHSMQTGVTIQRRQKRKKKKK